jgi:hypothetical protein
MPISTEPRNERVGAQVVQSQGGFSPQPSRSSGAICSNLVEVPNATKLKLGRKKDRQIKSEQILIPRNFLVELNPKSFDART